MATSGKTGKLRDGFTVDAQDFYKKFPDVTKKQIPKRIEEALYYAGQLLMRDAMMVRPFAPHLWGTLWRAQDVKQAVNKAGAWSLECGFNIEYAAKLHEAPDGWAWTLKGSGPKYLETKMAMYRDRYMAAVAEVIRTGVVPDVNLKMAA